jgi:antitoxin (DNA-binding transcriptional repressor) of toxin-antitoxin stability system
VIAEKEAGMRISIAEAEGKLTELARLANEGEEVVLTPDGLPSVRLEPVTHPAGTKSETEAMAAELRKPLLLAAERKPLSSAEKTKILQEIREMAKHRNLPWDTDAARSQDFLYDEHGLPK